MPEPSLLDHKYTIELDAADLDALYTAIAGPHNKEIASRLGHGIQHRAFNNLHKQFPSEGMPWPSKIRAALREEGIYSVADEPEWNAS